MIRPSYCATVLRNYFKLRNVSDYHQAYYIRVYINSKFVKIYDFSFYFETELCRLSFTLIHFMQFNLCIININNSV